MPSAPYMPFYVSDFLADTGHLKADEAGAYIRILCCLWGRKGVLPYDHRKLARIAGVSPQKWKSVWENIEEFFRIEAGQISNPRLTREYEKTATKIESARNNGSKGGRAKALKNKKSGLAKATNSLKQPEPEVLVDPLTGSTMNLREQKKSDSNAEPHPTARESGGGVVSCSGEWRPLRERLGESAYELWLDLRRELLRGGQFSTREVDQIKPHLEGYADGSFVIDTEPLEGKRWQAVQEIASAEGLSFSVKARPALKAIDGGKT